MATSQSRISVLETKVESIKEDIVEIKGDIKNVQSRIIEDKKELTTQLEKMYNASCEQHSQLAKEIRELKQFKNKWIYISMGGLTMLGWVVAYYDKLALFLH